MLLTLCHHRKWATFFPPTRRSISLLPDSVSSTKNLPWCIERGFNSSRFLLASMCNVHYAETEADNNSCIHNISWNTSRKHVISTIFNHMNSGWNEFSSIRIGQNTSSACSTCVCAPLKYIDTENVINLFAQNVDRWENTIKADNVSITRKHSFLVRQC